MFIHFVDLLICCNSRLQFLVTWQIWLDWCALQMSRACGIEATLWFTFWLLHTITAYTHTAPNYTLEVHNLHMLFKVNLHQQVQECMVINVKQTNFYSVVLGTFHQIASVSDHSSVFGHTFVSHCPKWIPWSRDHLPNWQCLMQFLLCQQYYTQHTVQWLTRLSTELDAPLGSPVMTSFMSLLFVYATRSCFIESLNIA